MLRNSSEWPEARNLTNRWHLCLRKATILTYSPGGGCTYDLYRYMIFGNFTKI